MSRIRGRHDVDRDVPEFLQELRVAQTGGQIYFAFLFSIAFTSTFADLSEGQLRLYWYDLIAVGVSTAVLIAPVAVHQWNFGRGLRPQWLVLTHVLALVGLGLLALGITLGVALVATLTRLDGAQWLTVVTAAALVLCWFVLPLLVRMRGSEWRVRGSSQDSGPVDRDRDSSPGA